ncbi:MAG: biopolymer transporter ExbD [Treponema sp.]|jgi:biopolymer transport protein ExbD|nr:biopolymer transporter ExbD [Treponema sp.]
MNLRHSSRSRRNGQLPGDSSASSDLAFLLIIYFIVIAGFNVNRGFLMNLPARDSTRLVKSEDLLRFDMERSGALIFRGERRDLADAEGIIRSAAASNPNIALLLRIDPAAAWQQVVSFVELARNLEVDSFSFSMAKDGVPDGGPNAVPPGAAP